MHGVGGDGDDNSDKKRKWIPHKRQRKRPDRGVIQTFEIACTMYKNTLLNEWHR